MPSTDQKSSPPMQTKIKCTLDCTYLGVLPRKIIQYSGSSVPFSDIISLYVN